jgi:formylglycine-generating enzyme required for sulfatase activity
MHKVLTSLLLGSIGLLAGCQDKQPGISKHELQNRLTQLESRALDSLVFIEGGTFIMGDFGAVGEDGVWRPYFPPTAERNTSHEVTLSSYSMSQHKTTWGDFDTYLLANDLPFIVQAFTKSWERTPFDQEPESRFFVEKPATVTWQEAKDYCQWLGAQTDLPLDLPTSAQWEFAGRNRGSKDWIFSTHDGKAPHLYYQQTQPRQGGEFVPIGSRLPPNPLGLYDMADNGKEWVNDWFSETWYRENPKVTDPQGPDEGTQKIVRNLDFSFSRMGVPESTPSTFNDEWTLIITNTFRCALQSSSPP